MVPGGLLAQQQGEGARWAAAAQTAASQQQRQQQQQEAVQEGSDEAARLLGQAKLQHSMVTLLALSAPCLFHRGSTTMG